MQNFIKLTLNLFDEGGAGTSSAGVAGTGEGSASTSTANTRLSDPNIWDNPLNFNLTLHIFLSVLFAQSHPQGYD